MPEYNPHIRKAQSSCGCNVLHLFYTHYLTAHHTGYFHPHRQTHSDKDLPETFAQCQCDGDDQQQGRSEEHTSELQSRPHLVCRLLLEKKKYLRSEYLR